MEVQQKPAPAERPAGAKARGPDGEEGQLRLAEGGGQVVEADGGTASCMPTTVPLLQESDGLLTAAGRPRLRPQGAWRT